MENAVYEVGCSLASYPEHLCQIIFEFGPAVQMPFILFFIFSSSGHLRWFRRRLKKKLMYVGRRTLDKDWPQKLTVEPMAHVRLTLFILDTGEQVLWQ